MYTLIHVTHRACLKMLMWSHYDGHLFLRHPGPDDIHQFESEQGLRVGASDLQWHVQGLGLLYSNVDLLHPAEGVNMPALCASV